MIYWKTVPVSAMRACSHIAERSLFYEKSRRPETKEQWFAFAHLFSPWQAWSKLRPAHLAYRKCSLSRTFSRHDIVQASLPLFIWLNENVLLASADKVFGKRLKDKFMKKKKYECPSVVVTNVSFSIMSGSGGYDPYDPYYASTNFSEGEPVANTSLW